MGRKLKHERSANGSTAASRSAAWRARKREAAGLPPVKTKAQTHAEEITERRQQLRTLRVMLIAKHGDRGEQTWTRIYSDEFKRLDLEPSA